MYNKVFIVIKEYANGKFVNIEPKRIICDFEKSLLNSLSISFPTTKITGCYFHYCQAIYRKIQKFGLGNVYNNNKNF